jgi:FlgD Ig-like domain
MKTASACSLLLVAVQLAQAQFTYPLQFGNRWQYKEPPPPDEPYVYEDIVLGDTVMPNGFVYKAIANGLSHENYYFRQEGQRVHEYLTIGDSLHRNQDIVRFDFSKGLRDTVCVYQITTLDTVTITVADTGKIEVFGKLRRFMEFYWSRRGSALYEMNWVVDSVGVSFTQIEPGLQLYLTGAVIDGATYGEVTSVLSPGHEEISGYTIFQNYPNPFNPSTTIRFQCARRVVGRLIVYDLNGREVRTLVSGELTAGDHSVVWDGTTKRGLRVSSGVFFCCLEVGSLRLSRIMVLLH